MILKQINVLAQVDAKGTSEEITNLSPPNENSHVEESEENNALQPKFIANEDWETDDCNSQDDTASISSGCSSNSSSAGSVIRVLSAY